MDINRDELRRELRDVEAEQKKADRGFTETLKRMFDPASDVDTATKAHVLGVPSRRSFLAFGGATVMGAAVLAACSSTSENVANTGSGASSSSSSAGAVDDVALAKTAASLEALAVAVYTNKDAAALVQDKAILDAATLFASHHQAHLDALNGLLKSAGQPAYTTPNAAVNEMIVMPAVANAKSQDDVVALAFTLEDAAAQTYVFATTLLTKPEYRSALMTISGVEARHRAILGRMVQKKDPAEVIPVAFFKKDNPLPRGAVIS